MEIISLINEYWVVITAFIGIITSFVLLKFQNNEQERRIKYLEEKIEELNPIWVEIKERLAGIEATLKMLTK